jgi:hypothetical protein
VGRAPEHPDACVRSVRREAAVLVARRRSARVRVRHPRHRTGGAGTGDARRARGRGVRVARLDASAGRQLLCRREAAPRRAPAALEPRTGGGFALLDAAAGGRAGSRRFASCSWTRSGCGCEATSRSVRR